MNDATTPAAPILLRIAAVAYGRLQRSRNRYFDRPGAARRAGVPVLSVGNLTVGGTGKTPLVAWLAQHLSNEGRRPAIVSRGYRGTAGRGPLIVSLGRGPECSPRVCGDEPYLLARRLPGITVVVGSNRLAGALAAEQHGADVIVLDDGFQHRRLARDLDIVLLDASNPFGDDALLPAGTLREPVSGLARADVVLVTRSEPADSITAIERVVRRYNTGAPLLRSGHRPLGFFDTADRPVARPDRAVAFCGIGNPGRFRIDLRALGVEIVAFRPKRDHHRFRERELCELGALAAAHGAALVTTDKDLARMISLDRPDLPAPLLTLRIEAVVHEPRPLLEAVRRASASKGR